MYYYAILDEGFVSSVTSSSTQLTGENYIEITYSQYTDSSLIGMRYDPYTKTFTERVWWSCTTDEVEYSRVQELSLTNKLDLLDSAVNTHSHPAMIQTINKSLTLTLSNGTYSGTLSASEFVDGGTYLLSVNYINSNTLADRTLYAFRYDSSKKLQTTILLVDGKNANDSLLATYSSGTFTFASQYTGTATSATVKVI